MKNFLKSLFSDEAGNFSSKRIVGVFTAFILNLVLILNCFIDNMTINAELIGILGLLTFGCLGLSTIDKFSKTKDKNN